MRNRTATKTSTAPKDGQRLLGTHVAAKTSTAHQRQGDRASLEDDPLVGTIEVARMIMCHPVTVFRYMRERPDFPQPIRLSANRLAWRRSQIIDYVASRPLRERGQAVAR